jgi:Flp pilus assembly protein TadD
MYAMNCLCTLRRPAPRLLLLACLAIVGGCASSKDKNRAVARPPRTGDAARLNAQAVEQIEKGDFEHAEKILKESLAADVSFGPAHNNLGLVYYHANKLYQAAWEFEYATKLMPYMPEPRNNLGMVFERIGKLDEAIERYGQALQIAPDDPQFIGNLARAKVRKGDNDPQTRDLLDQLVLKDTRPDWVEWARERLVRWGPPADAAASTQPVSQ